MGAIRRFAFLSILLTFAVPCVAQDASQKIQVRSIEVQRVGGETLFRVGLTWPAAEVPDNHYEFSRRKGKNPFGMMWNWPPDSVALIPGDDSAHLVFRDLSEETEMNQRMPFIQRGLYRRAPSEVSFLGKLKKVGTIEFQLRCPSPKGDYRYLPVVVDFKKAKKAKGLKKAWTLAEAVFLGSYMAPSDQSFFGYAFSRLRARLGKGGQNMQFRGNRNPDRGGLYEVTTGALALQESLQLERMASGAPDRGKRTIPVKSIQGVTVKSHPWKEMIGDKKPQIEPIASLVPEDQYYIRFTTSKALRNFLDFLNAWGGSLLSQVEVGGRDYGTREKIEQQMCIRASWLSDMLGPAVVESLVVTGTDPYLREGSDFSLIFRLKSPKVFEAAVNRYIQEAKEKHSNLKESKQVYRKIKIQRFSTGDGVVNCHRARIGDYYIYSNHPQAIRRIIDTHLGKRPSLAKSLDFVYMRTEYPLGDESEDGFIFLSDAWLRFLTGPGLRIAQKRRIETVTSLEMIKNAALFYLWEHPGSRVPTMKTLVKRGYLDNKHLYKEPGDRLQWNPKRFMAESKKYGRLGYLTPNLELPVSKISKQEKTEYENFRRFYQDYWRRYFDPIGIRVSAGKDISMQVTILPLIDNSEYNTAKGDFGGQAVNLEPQLRSGPVILHYATHLNPESPDLKRAQMFAVNMLGGERATVEWIGERLEFWVEDSEVLGKLIKEENFKDFFKVPIVFGIEVKNKFGLAAFLVALQSMIKTGAPGLVSFEPSEPYKKVSFTSIRPAPGSRADDELKDAALHYGAIGDMLYVSTSLDALKRIVDATPESGSKDEGQAVTSFGAARKSHMAVRVNARAATKTKVLIEQLLIGLSLEAEREHLRNLWLIAHTVGLGDGAEISPEQVLGYRIDSSVGNQFSYDRKHDEIVGSVFGTLWQPKELLRLSDSSPLGQLLKTIDSMRATLEFTKEGLHTEMTVRRD